ncbi:beta-1,3-galactosyltransferase 5-like [Lytechinus pictus]|uniref:beta-1,3-galactosyltransferase 5-like n=1 Tax=Lytechinus pictus TaxID=7653 RepID=UPI0030BA11F6
MKKLFLILIIAFSIVQFYIYSGKSILKLTRERFIRSNTTSLSDEYRPSTMRTFQTEQTTPQTTASVPLLGWLKDVHWRPAPKLDIYDYFISPFDKCKVERGTITLLVLVKSAPGNGQRREGARQSYIRGAAEKNVSARVVFVIGDSEDQGERDNIQKESQTHGDIVGIGFHDNYYNLTIKLIMSFKWAINSCNSAFVLITDDDVVIDLVTLVNDLNAIPQSERAKIVIGTKGVGFSPHRNTVSKWYIPEEFYPNKDYPPFPFGHGYVMSHEVVEQLVQVSRETPALIPFDDVYCGILLDKLGVTILHQPVWFKDRHPVKHEQGYLKIEVPVPQMKTSWETFEVDIEHVKR